MILRLYQSETGHDWTLLCLKFLVCCYSLFCSFSFILGWSCLPCKFKILVIIVQEETLQHDKQLAYNI
jgi:hypothetical protein